MANITISSSSFLLPTNNAWESLRGANNLVFSDYGDWSGALLNTPENEVVVVVLFLKDLLPNSEIEFESAQALSDPFFNLLSLRLNRATAPTIVFFSSWQMDNVIRSAKIESRIEKISSWISSEFNLLSNQFVTMYKIDLDRKLAEIGFNNSFDKRNWYSAHCHLSIGGLRELVSSISSVLRRLEKPASKVLVLDCDNTLWGGVIGEDGDNGLTLGQDGLGQAFVDFQKAAQILAKHGVLLTLCSKNNQQDVWDVFYKNQFMAIKKNDIAAWKINWEDKASNIRALAAELDLGLDSFVFWDDNPMERDMVRNALPDVLVVEPPEGVFDWPDYLLKLDAFAKFYVSYDDKDKTAQYHNRAKFVRDKSTIQDETSYLRSINLNPKALEIDDGTVSRAAQLCAKTNQYNLRTIRHSEADLLKLIEGNEELCFLVGLSDTYGDHGIVGLVCLKPLNSDLLFLDTFLMSCRVLGRHLEAWMLNEAILRMRKFGYKYLIGQCIPTQKNTIAQNFLPIHGFTSMLDFKLEQSHKNEVKKIPLWEDLYIAKESNLKIPYLDIYKND